MNPSRRNLLKTALLGSGFAGLRSIATGLPLSLFTVGLPRGEALAMEPGMRKFLVLSTSGAGDPWNANGPGTYGIDGVIANPNPGMEPTDFNLGDDVTTRAAAPWANLSPEIRARTCFVHHRTYQNAHPQFGNVLELVGSARGATGSGSEQLASVLSSENSTALGTIQSEPISLRGNVKFEGRVLQELRPQTLSSIFSIETGTALQLAQLREQTLDALHATLKARGTPAQKRWVDRFVISREQARSLDESLLSRFDAITGSGAQDQVSAAVALILMRVSPVVQIRIPFGGDNHQDTGLVREANETISGVARISQLFDSLRDAGIEDQVLFANLNVFGRTLGPRNNPGRDHNLNHHMMVISGAGVKPGVFGKIERVNRDFGAIDIDSVTGAGVESGDIPRDQSLEAVAKTLAVLSGVDRETTSVRIDGGKVIEAAVA